MKSYSKLYIVSILLLTVLSILLYISTSFSFYDHLLKVYIFDVGQGDSIFIRTPSGTQFIVDGGPKGSLVRNLKKVMPFFDRTIDGLMITNPDTDHYAGFLDLLNYYKVDFVVEAGTISNTPTYGYLESIIEDKSIKKIIAKRGMRIVLDSDYKVYLDILFPDRDVSTLSTNDGSIISRLVYGSSALMLQGDAPQKIEKYMIELDKNSVKADVLKLGHHSSKTSSAYEYVEAVSPKYAVASLGEGNSYGFPHKETVDTLNKLDVPFLRTDKLGTIEFVSDGKSFVLK